MGEETTETKRIFTEAEAQALSNAAATKSEEETFEVFSTLCKEKDIEPIHGFSVLFIADRVSDEKRVERDIDRALAPQYECLVDIILKRAQFDQHLLSVVLGAAINSNRPRLVSRILKDGHPSPDGERALTIIDRLCAAILSQYPDCVNAVIAANGLREAIRRTDTGSKLTILRAACLSGNLDVFKAVLEIDKSISNLTAINDHVAALLHVLHHLSSGRHPGPNRYSDEFVDYALSCHGTNLCAGDNELLLITILYEMPVFVKRLLKNEHVRTSANIPYLMHVARAVKNEEIELALSAAIDAEVLASESERYEGRSNPRIILEAYSRISAKKTEMFDISL
jgi:hypothetical protein